MLAREQQDIKAAVFIADTAAKWFKSHLTAKGKEMKAIRALMLVLVLSVCAYADGNMETDRSGNMETDKTGNMQAAKTSAIDPVMETALQLLQSLLPLF